jgi:hypothetical protein
VPSRQPRPDIAALADEEPPPALGGKAALFSVRPASRPPRRHLANSVLPIEAGKDEAGHPMPSEPQASTELAPEPAQSAPLQPPALGALRVQRSYVLGREHDQMVRRMAARLYLKIDQVVEDALDAFIGAKGLAVDLLQLREVPISAGARAIDPVRRTVWLRSDQAEILRTCRLIFDVEASDLVRQAVEARFDSYGFAQYDATTERQSRR